MSAFFRLHGAHAATTFPDTFGPPFARGYTWSSVAESGASSTAQ
jgi:hypothetical protein